MAKRKTWTKKKHKKNDPLTEIEDPQNNSSYQKHNVRKL